MSISIAGIGAQGTRLLIALTVYAIACCPTLPFTYAVHLQEEPLPPGVNPDPSQFRARVAVRGVGSTHNQRRLGNCTPSCLVDVEVAPVGDTREVNPDGGRSPLAPIPGRPVAKIVNLDKTHVEGMYGFKPSSQFEYYVWADTAASHARITLLEVPAVGQPGAVHAIFQKSLRLCAHDPSAPPSSDADFRWCEGVSVSTGLNVNRAGMFPVAPVAALLSRVSEFVAGKSSAAQPPIWLRCTDGCCG